MKFCRDHALKIYLTITIAILLVIGGIQNQLFTDWEFIKSDGVGYHIYLPSLIHNGSLEHSESLSQYTGLAVEDLPYDVLGIYRLENGNYLSKYPPGVAIMQAPFYIAASAIAWLVEQITGNTQPQYSPIYQWSNFISAVFYFAMSSVLMIKILTEKFGRRITYGVTGIIFLATNIIHYTTYDASFSHVYALSLTSLLLWLVTRKNYLSSYRHLLLSGFVLGLIVLVRNTNVISGLLPLVAILTGSGLWSRSGFKNWQQKFANIVKQGALVAMSFIATAAPLLLYWKVVTGSFLLNSYGEEGFNFLEPQFANVLFNVTSGSFFWHPILALATIGLVWGAYRYRDKFTITAIVITLINFYIIASWWAWWFGFSFGHRGFTDLYIFFAIGLGYLGRELLRFQSSTASKYAKYIVTGLVILALLFLSYLNLVQTNHQPLLARDIGAIQRHCRALSTVLYETLCKYPSGICPLRLRRITILPSRDIC